jgi:hypothetical protein
MSKSSLVTGNIRLEKRYSVQVHIFLFHPFLSKRYPLLLLRVEFLLQLSISSNHSRHFRLQIFNFFSITLLQTDDLTLQLYDFIAEKLDFLVFVLEESFESQNFLV